MTPKTAIVTGAASGIGKHWANTLLKQDGKLRLVLADMNENGLRKVYAPSENLRLHSLDIRSVEGWQRVVEDTVQHYGQIDYLFNIAGISRQSFFLSQPVENIDLVIDVILKGPLLGMRIVGEVMQKQGTGHIINIGSLAGMSPTPGNALYSAAKGGLRNASIAAAIEWRRQGVAVTVILPDLVDTPVMQKHIESGGDEVALTYTGVTLTVEDIEKALWQAVRDKPLEITLPRWRGWLTKLNHANPSLMYLLYEPMKKRGMKRLAKIRKQRLGGEG